MSENRENASSEASKPSIDFNVFKAFYDKNPDLDNAEYYSQFPQVNQGTVRSWKAKARQHINEPEPRQQSTPQEQDKSEIINTMIDLTRIDKRILEGLNQNAQIKYLQNYAQLMNENKGQDPNIGIIPTPARSSKRMLGIEKYITFNPQNKMVKMNIPASIAHDPEKNKQLGEYIEE
jgi:hypothetical protein